MDPEVGALLAELDAGVCVIDCLPNMEAQAVAERTEPLVRQLRAARPDAPIVLVEDRTYMNTPFFASRRRRHTTSRAELKGAHNRLRNCAEISYRIGIALTDGIIAHFVDAGCICCSMDS